FAIILLMFIAILVEAPRRPSSVFLLVGIGIADRREADRLTGQKRLPDLRSCGDFGVLQTRTGSAFCKRCVGPGLRNRLRSLRAGRVARVRVGYTERDGSAVPPCLLFLRATLSGYLGCCQRRPQEFSDGIVRLALDQRGGLRICRKHRLS